MSLNLLDFGFNQSTFTDRFASFSDHDKFRKMITKSNVNMIVDKFVPFNKAKRLKTPTKSILSIEGTHLDDTYQDIELNVASGKDKHLVINTEYMAESMAAIEPEHHFEYFEGQMKFAYGLSANLSRSAAFGEPYIKLMNDGDLSEEYMDMIDVATSVARASIAHYLPNYKKTLKLSISEQPSTKIEEFIAAMVYGEPDNYDSLKLKQMKAGNVANAEDIVRGIISEDMAAHNVKRDEFIDTDFIPRVNANSSRPENDNKGKEACEIGNNKVEYDESPSFSEQPTDKDKQFEEYNDVLKNPQTDKAMDNRFFTKRDNENREFEKYDYLVDALYESLSGRDGKKKSLSASKRLNTRAVASDLGDKLYVSTNHVDGKNLHINLILDTSGSMSGNYIEDSMSILYVFNELAIRGVVKGNIMLSCSGYSGMWKFPMDVNKLKQIGAHNGGEGFKHTMAIRWRELQEADFNLALTDGKLTDGYIDKTDFMAAGIEITGMYIDRCADKKRLLEYTGGLNQWFSKSIVRTSVEEGVYAIVDSSILRMKNGD